MKIVIFGTGRFYQNRKEEIPSDTEIVAFLDNNEALHGQYMDGCPIVSPCEAKELCYDKIILMSASEEAMKIQLLSLGIDSQSIWYWGEFVSEYGRNVLKVYYAQNNIIKPEKRILLITTYLDYVGGTIAALYAAKALQSRHYSVFLAAPGGNKRFIDETLEEGIHVIISPSLPFVHKKGLFWIQQFDVVIVNVFQMVLCACEISRIKPVLWWIHEPGVLYEETLSQFQKYICMEQLKKCGIYAVSNIAQRNFNTCFMDRIEKVLPYGIPDCAKSTDLKNETDDLVFALIGAVCPRKAQDVFIKAVKLLKEEERKNAQFWLIGYIGTDEYSNQMRSLAAEDEALKIMGLLTRSEIYEIYDKIDVVVCPSREDPLPIVVTEGMMYGKTCIVSDKAGNVQYITDKENGLICKAADAENLCEQMRWVIQNKEKLSAIGTASRQTYEKYFSMESFGQRLDEALQDTMEQYIRGR